jgi:hypothetical protein
MPRRHAGLAAGGAGGAPLTAPGGDGRLGAAHRCHRSGSCAGRPTDGGADTSGAVVGGGAQAAWAWASGGLADGVPSAAHAPLALAVASERGV